MRLLSENDWRHLSSAMHRGEEIVLERETADGSQKIRASTIRADYPWNVPVILRVEEWWRGWYCSKYSESVEEGRKYVGSH